MKGMICIFSRNCRVLINLETRRSFYNNHTTFFCVAMPCCVLVRRKKIPRLDLDTNDISSNQQFITSCFRVNTNSNIFGTQNYFPCTILTHQKRLFKKKKNASLGFIKDILISSLIYNPEIKTYLFLANVPCAASHYQTYQAVDR